MSQLMSPMLMQQMIQQQMMGATPAAPKQRQPWEPLATPPGQPVPPTQNPGYSAGPAVPPMPGPPPAGPLPAAKGDFEQMFQQHQANQAAMLQKMGANAPGGYNMAQVGQAMTPPPAAPAASAGAAGPTRPAMAMATAPPTMPPPLFAMPQMYSEGNLPTNQQMQQMPGGQYVAQGQVPAAQHALGLDRLPDFDTYAKTHPSQLPGQVFTSGVGVDPRFGGFSPAQQQQAVLAQYQALQGNQSQADQNATARMTAGDAGAYQRGQLGLGQQQNALAAYEADPRHFAVSEMLKGLGAGTVQPYEAGAGIQAANSLVQNSGVAAPPGYPQPAMPAPQGGSALPMQPGQAMPSPAGPPVYDAATAANMMPPINNRGVPQAGQAQDPLLSATDPSAISNALHEAATGGVPKVNGVRQPRSQAEIVLQFEANHPGVLQQSPQALQAMGAFLGQQPEGDAGLQKLWRTGQGGFGKMFNLPPSSDQRAQTILQQAVQHHTGQPVPQTQGLGGFVPLGWKLFGGTPQPPR